MPNKSEIKLDPLLSEEQMPLLPTELAPLNSFKKEPSTPFHLTELLEYPEINDRIFKTVDEDFIVLAQAIKGFYDHVSTTSEEAFKQGFQTGRRVTHSASLSALHIAERKGDIAEMKKLINQSDGVNTKAHLSSTPSQIAMLFGKTETSTSNNSEDSSTKGIQLAIHKEFDNTAETLTSQVDNTAEILASQVNVNPSQPNAKNETPLNMFVDTFISKIQNQGVAEQISNDELLAKISSIASEQKYDNDTWESYHDAIKGMILIELLNLNTPSSTTRDTVHQYFQEWDRFQEHSLLKEYFSGSAVLPEGALVDIFNEIHQKGYDQFTEHEKTYVKTIIDAFVSPTDDTKFKHWLNNNFSENGHQLKTLFSDYGLDVMENDHASGKGKLTKIPFNEVIAQFKAFYQDPETTSLQETTVPEEVISLHSGISTTPTLSHLEVVTEVF